MRRCGPAAVRGPGGQWVRNPVGSTGVGLLLFGAQSLSAGGVSQQRAPNGVQDMWERMKQWFQGSF